VISIGKGTKQKYYPSFSMNKKEINHNSFVFVSPYKRRSTTDEKWEKWIFNERSMMRDNKRKTKHKRIKNEIKQK